MASNFSDNLSSFLKLKGISVRAVEQQIGCSNGVISRCINKGTDISSQWVSKILEIFPDLSADWLMTGKGEMLKTDYTSRQNSVPQTPIIDQTYSEIPVDIQANGLGKKQTRPRIPYEAAAGSLSIAIDSISENQCDRLPLIPTFPSYDFTIIARGDSMEPNIESGDELACRFIKESAFIQWGRTHVLDTAQGIVVKRIFESKDCILCRSNNKDYPDILVPKNDIYHMALVVGLLRHY